MILHKSIILHVKFDIFTAFEYSENCWFFHKNLLIRMIFMLS